MSTPRPSPGSDTTRSGPPAFAERLVVPWWWWPPVLLMAGLLAAELHMGYPGVRSWLPYVLLLPLAVVLLVWLGRVRIAVDGDERGGRELHVGAAHLPVSQIGRIDVVTGEAKRQALGPQLDPEAFVLHRPWVGPVARIEVLDPDDPTPYWVVSTRHPDDLLRALRESGRTMRHSRGR